MEPGGAQKPFCGLEVGLNTYCHEGLMCTVHHNNHQEMGQRLTHRPSHAQSCSQQRNPRKAGAAKATWCGSAETLPRFRVETAPTTVFVLAEAHSNLLKKQPAQPGVA